MGSLSTVATSGRLPGDLAWRPSVDASRRRLSRPGNASASSLAKPWVPIQLETIQLDLWFKNFKLFSKLQDISAITQVGIQIKDQAKICSIESPLEEILDENPEPVGVSGAVVLEGVGAVLLLGQNMILIQCV